MLLRTCPLLLLTVATAAAAAPPDWRNGWLEAPTAAAPINAGDDAAQITHSAVTRQIEVQNLLAGPVQVRVVAMPSQQIALERVLPAARRAPVSLTTQANDASPKSFVLEAVPGAPGSGAHGSQVLYHLPFATPRVRVDQGFGGQHSHDDAENRYALDFPLAEGTPVLAARAGTVMQVIDHHHANHQDRSQRGRGANLVRVLHEDGSMALYAHLAPGAAVRPGQRVSVGTVLGRSGNTGFSTAPHLHFVVQANTGMALTSLPFRLGSDAGELHFPAPPAAATPAANVAASSPL